MRFKRVVIVLAATKKLQNGKTFLAIGTLRDRVTLVLRAGKYETEATVKEMGRCKTIFFTELENKLVSYILELETKLFGLTVVQLQRSVASTK